MGRSKGDRQQQGRVFKCPALSRLCPVTAFNAWVGLTEGPVFRKINRWGHVAEDALHPHSLIALLRSLFSEVGVVAPGEYSSHSMRRGFASWTRASGWDIKELMEYVGWKDVKSAMRYLDASDSNLQARFEQGLPALASTAPQPPPPLLLLTEQVGGPRLPEDGTTLMAVLRVTMVLQLFDTVARCMSIQAGTQIAADSQPTLNVPASKNSTALVVDDNAVNLKVACAMLSRLGYQTQTALDGQEAVEAAARAQAAGLHFGLILMDVNMPRMNGLQATAEIHALLGRQSPPIIALTAAASAEDSVRCMQGNRPPSTTLI